MAITMFLTLIENIQELIDRLTLDVDRLNESIPITRFNALLIGNEELLELANNDEGKRDGLEKVIDELREMIVNHTSP